VSEEPTRHGIGGGGYDNLMRHDLGRPAPFLWCLCGFETVHGAADSWAEAGAMLDDHLAEVEPGRNPEVDE
jgi:hypothetical protein